MDEAPLHLPFRFANLGGLFLPTANIASDLSPQVKPHLRPDSVVRVVGYDGFSLTKPDYIWREELSQWLKCGASVRYLLQRPLEETPAAVREVRSLAGASGSLAVRQMEEDGPSGLASQWSTFHFVIVENPNLLWVEECHPHHDTVAQRCYFFDDTRTASVPAYSVLQAQFDRVFASESSALLTV
jgi:hypothetical protein